MKRFSPYRWFVNISIANKLYFTIGIMALLILLELCTLWFSVNMLSAVRASVGQEGTWSKAQKDAIHTLGVYARTGNTEDYQKVKNKFHVHYWDKIAFGELKNTSPDEEVMYHAFVNSGIHAEDGRWVVVLFNQFGFVSYIEKCINIFWQGDALMKRLVALTEELHTEITENGLENTARINSILNEVDNLNTEFTVLEQYFTTTLGEAARWLDNIVLRLLLAIALTVETTGILLAISISRNISKGIKEIIRTSKKVAQGNFEDKATIYSKDEIGQLAAAFNNMVDEVAVINKELEQFVYVASHDLQEPLRTVSNFSNLLQNEEFHKTEEEAHQYLQLISEATSKMQQLVKDLMEFSRVGRNIQFKNVSLQQVLKDVVLQLNSAITESGAKIYVPKLPAVTGNEIELRQLFQNLISNGIKFTAEGVVPEIHIGCKDMDTHYQISVADNGIGIDVKYMQKIFIVFQRLHTEAEYSGTGIGLATCKKIIDLHNGKLWLESELGLGSTFYFTLPKK